MTQERTRSFSGSDRAEDEEYQTYFVPRTFIPNDHRMLAYNHLSNHDQHPLPLLLGDSFNRSFTHEPNYSSLGYSGAAIPTSYQQLAYHPQQDFTDIHSNVPYLPRSGSSIHLNPFCGTMEPQMMLRHEDYSPVAQDYDFSSAFAVSTSACSPDIGSGTTASPPCSFTSSNDRYYPCSAWQHSSPTFQLPDVESSSNSLSDGFEDEDEGTYDKPYAQLIYDALMDAPGHRMLLRDIYEWFLHNTRKPQESGTNGWQNSIRHNLSMNQAFENDKNDPASSRGVRKANSVWVLTEHAIKHGVQSTTRYRKTGTTKKGVGSRIPAIQRQRSGAKGGRAARRAARLKRQEEGQRRTRTVLTENGSQISFGHSRSPLPIAPDQWSNYSCSPTTPAEDQFLSTTYTLPHRSYYEYDQEMEPKDDTEPFPYEDEHLRQMLSQTASEDVFEDAARPC